MVVHAGAAVMQWLTNLAIASVALLPIWFWWSRAAVLPEADLMIERFHVGIFRDLLIDGGGLGLATIGLTVAGLLLVSIPVGVLLAGGTLEVIIAEDREPFFQRFLRGAGHFFWRFLRLTILAGVVTVVTVTLVAIVSNFAVDPFYQSHWPQATVVALVLQAFLISVVTAYFMLSFDYARIRLALNDQRGTLRAWFASLWLVARHPLRTFGLATVFAILFGLAVAAYLFAIAALGTHTMGLILISIAIQQIFVLTRAALRVGMLAGEIELYQWLRPPAPASPRGLVSTHDAHMDPELPELPS
jgi:hypothetical protein